MRRGLWADDLLLGMSSFFATTIQQAPWHLRRASVLLMDAASDTYRSELTIYLGAICKFKKGENSVCRMIFIAAGVSSFLACACHGFSQTQAVKVERGRYLVNQVGKCGDCHTPRVAGAPDKTKWLKGSVLGVKPLGPVPGWASAAPDLTGTGPLWSAWGEKGLVQFFISGHGPQGQVAGPPMPTYTLTEQDAESIVAYLKSLP
jgi:mono/diheme cytochrome c family protein